MLAFGFPASLPGKLHSREERKKGRRKKTMAKWADGGVIYFYGLSRFGFLDKRLAVSLLLL